MAIRSLGNSKVRYAAVLKESGVRGADRNPLWYGGRGTWGGGDASPDNVIDYVAIDTTGNATDFGDLTQARGSVSACSNGLRGCYGGGYTSGGVTTIDYITITTTGNATDFGDLADRWNTGCVSDGLRGV